MLMLLSALPISDVNERAEANLLQHNAGRIQVHLAEYHTLTVDFEA